MSRTHSPERWEQYYSTVIRKGLQAALADASIEGNLSEFDDGHIKLNKLMYAAMAEKGLYDELQHSWHIYGADLGDLVPSTNSVGPKAYEDLPKTIAPESASSDSQEIKTEEIREFFNSIEIGSLQSLEEILSAETTELLEEFYKQYGQDIERWLDLYLVNVEIQKYLTLHQEDDPVDFDKRDYHELSETISEFRTELYSYPELSPSEFGKLKLDVQIDQNPADLFSEFLTLIDDVYYVVSESPPEEISNDVSYVLDRLKEFYHQKAWKLITEVISLQTIRGPRHEPLERGAKREIENLIRTYEFQLERVESECQSAWLLPEEQEVDFTEQVEENDHGVNESEADKLPTREELANAMEGK